MQEITIPSLFDLSKAGLAENLFAGHTYPWKVLPYIHDYILELGKTLDPAQFVERAPQVWIHRSVQIADTATINGPCIIDEGTEVRPGAFIRGNALIGKDAVVGNSTEVKNAVIFEGVQVPHYNYVGDSVLGYKAHMGAGAITSNIKADKTNVVVKGNGYALATGLRKMGAMLGDYTDIGCNSVLNPGTIVGRHTNVYPLSMLRGVIPADSIYKGKNEIAAKKKTFD